MGSSDGKYRWNKTIIVEILIIGKTETILCLPIFIETYKQIFMAKVTYIEHSNKEHTVEVSNGMSIMEGAVQNNIPGIDADCGGGMACATCHVYVKEEWLDKLPTKEDGEEDMLDMAFEPKNNSRLSCQLIVSDELDGLEVNIPSKQG